MQTYSRNKHVKTMHTGKSGFTLIEISIVFTIIALIIGGILLGRDVLQNSRLQSIVSDVSDFQGAIKQFKDKYGYYPGDFPNANGMWSESNGDGDGFIARDTTPATTAVGAENTYAWAHLAKSEFLKVKYDIYGYNRAGSKIENNMYTLFYSNPTASAAGVFNARYGHILVYGTRYTNSSYPSYGPGLTALEAMSTDQKMDDGRPGTGVVMTYTTALAATPTCVTSANQVASVYRAASGTSINTLSCALIFLTGF